MLFAFLTLFCLPLGIAAYPFAAARCFAAGIAAVARGVDVYKRQFRGLPFAASAACRGGDQSLVFCSMRCSSSVSYTHLADQPGGQVISRPESTWKCRCCTVWPACSPQLVIPKEHIGSAGELTPENAGICLLYTSRCV